MKITATERKQLEEPARELKPVKPRVEMAKKKMTDLDIKYVNAIRAGGSSTVAEIAKAVDQGRSVVAWRLNRLRKMGKIRRVNDEKNGLASLYLVAEG